MLTILFDVDNTLYDQKIPFINAYAEVFNSSYDIDLDKLYFSSRKYSDMVFEKAQSGEITMEDMYIFRMKNAFKDFDIDISDKEALEFQRSYAQNQKMIEMSPIMKNIINYCSSRVNLGAVTNGPTRHQFDKAKSLGLTKWIPKEKIFISEEQKASKPDKRIFEIALEKLNIKAEDSYFIGDSFENDVIGAKGANIKTIWFNRDQKEIPLNTVNSDYIVNSEEDLFELIKSII